VEMRAHINMQGLYFKMRRVGELLALRAAGWQTQNDSWNLNIIVQMRKASTCSTEENLKEFKVLVQIIWT
jgi:hypothetical protein